MIKLDKFYFGKITEVYPPNHPNNKSKYQYEYQVLITGDDYAQLPTRAIKNDAYGMIDDYKDEILTKNTNVFVLFPRGDASMGVIMGGGRFTAKAQDPAKGKYYLHRFNKIEIGIDKDYNYMVKSDSGPYTKVNTNKIVLDDSVGENITLDKENKVLSIDANKWVVHIKGDANITIDGNLTATVAKDATIKAKNVNVTAEAAAKIKCKDLTAEASGNAKIKAKAISLNGEQSPITTEQSHQGVIDLITGVPVIGVPTVKSGQ
jgi:hypothetical protein